jgi:hypothetical protein
MRARWSLLAVAAALLVPLACGGGTPAAKDADDVATSGGGDDAKSAGSKASPADSSASAGDGAGDKAPAPAASAANAGAGGGAGGAAGAGGGGSSSGDIKVPGDDPWMAAHQMPPKDVIKTMHAANGKVQACFKAGLKRDPSTSGDVKLKFVVTNDGAVRVWKDDASSMSDGDVTQCVGETLSKLKFPKQKSPGDAWGTFSIHFGQ